MAFGGYCGIYVDINGLKNVPNINDIDVLFAEECGWVIEIEEKHLHDVLLEIDAPACVIGYTSTYGKNSNV